MFLTNNVEKTRNLTNFGWMASFLFNKPIIPLKTVAVFNIFQFIAEASRARQERNAPKEDRSLGVRAVNLGFCLCLPLYLWLPASYQTARLITELLGYSSFGIPYATRIFQTDTIASITEKKRESDAPEELMEDLLERFTTNTETVSNADVERLPFHISKMNLIDCLKQCYHNTPGLEQNRSPTKAYASTLQYLNRLIVEANYLAEKANEYKGQPSKSIPFSVKYEPHAELKEELVQGIEPERAKLLEHIRNAQKDGNTEKTREVIACSLKASEIFKKISEERTRLLKEDLETTIKTRYAWSRIDRLMNWGAFLAWIGYLAKNAYQLYQKKDYGKWTESFCFIAFCVYIVYDLCKQYKWRYMHSPT
ncbi:MAG: hypothetical protein JSR58_02065 [Verrucomicrobia bacterium]|nr:hypothetical protein [Verrucomicrobiota bacterium]